MSFLSPGYARRMATNSMTVRQFIEKVFMAEIPSLTSNAGGVSVPAHFLQCSLIAPAFEVLGAVRLKADARVADSRVNQPFDVAIRELDALKKYRDFRCDSHKQEWVTCPWKDADALQPNHHACLYHGWRCKAVHQFRPLGFGYMTLEEAEGRKKTHLEADGDVRVLIAEDLVTDFTLACKQILSKKDLEKTLDTEFIKLPSSLADDSQSISPQQIPTNAQSGATSTSFSDRCGATGE